MLALLINGSGNAAIDLACNPGSQHMHDAVRVTLLGIAQDGGRPQAGCTGACCEQAINNPNLATSPVSLGVATSDGRAILIDATRDLAAQLTLWSSSDTRAASGELPTELWLTHAHLGHIDGLGLFGPEAMSSHHLPIHCSPAMAKLFGEFPQWKSLVNKKHLKVKSWAEGSTNLNHDESDSIITPVPVPHRAEFGDTHAFIISGKNRRLLYLPDHDSWSETLKLHNATSIREWLQNLSIDIALLDGTFWSGRELTGRDQSEVPHPTVSGSIERLSDRLENDPRIIFIHLNHTNPLHNNDSTEAKILQNSGWEIGSQGMVFDL
jgi:pyrroloquinoline quinone biosynthesis protein B